MSRRRRVGLALCLVSAAGFGSLAVFGKQAYAGGLGVVEVLALRFGIAGPLLVALAAVTGRACACPGRSPCGCSGSARSATPSSRRCSSPP